MSYDLIRVDRETDEIIVLATHDELPHALADLQERRKTTDPSYHLAVMPAGVQRPRGARGVSPG